jgi:putative ABC transport system permease protein
MVKVQTARWRASVGYTDLMVQAWWESPTRYFSKELVNDMEEYMEYAIGTVSGYGLYQDGKDHTVGVNLWGIGFDELNRIAEVRLTAQADLYPFAGKKIIISSYTANRYDLTVGDSIPLLINGTKQKFMICGIAQKEGAFIADGDISVCGVVPTDTIRSLCNVRGKIDCLYLKLKNPANKAQLQRILERRYDLYQVREPFTEAEIRTQNNKVKMPFLALTIILSFMSIYIINSTFKVITFERLPDIGAFRSIGAGKYRISGMLLLESLFYGSAGGMAGCLLGVCILYLMSIFTMPVGDGGYRAAISFEPKQLIFTFAAAVLLCLVSSIRPILRVNKIPVKDIILNMVENRKRSRLLRVFAGISVMGFGVFAPILVKGDYSVYINAVCIAAIIAGLVLLIPFLAKIIIRLIDPVYTVLFGNIGGIAVKNLRDNRSMNGSVSLLAIGISCVLFVNTLSFSTFQEIENYYDRNTYEIYMSAKGADNRFLQDIRTTPGVKEVTKVLGLGGIELVNEGDAIGLTQGVDTNNYLSYNNLSMPGDREELLNLLDKGRGILLTNRLRDRFGLKAGDKLQLRAWGKSRVYTVAGFFRSIENSGDYALMSEKYMRLDMGWRDGFYSVLMIKTDEDPDKVVESLKAKFVRQQPYIKTVRNMKLENILYNEQIYLIARGFSIITMLAGILGIFNNLAIYFIQRRRHLAMYRSAGMSRVQLVSMLFIEALTTGLIGSLAGITAGVLMILSGEGLLKSLEIEINTHYSGTQLILSLILGIVISVIASVWPALKSSRLNLMEAIKYE